MFYAYVHLKPDLTPFYVGKGRIDRVRTMGRRNVYYRRIIKKYGAENIIVEKIECRSESEAFLREILAIKALKASRVKLANITDGGDGPSGYKWSKPSPKRGIPISDAQKAKLAAKARLRSMSAETKAKIAETMRKRICNQETRARHSAAMRLRWSDEASRSLLVKRRRDRGPYSEESRLRMSESQRRRQAREKGTRL